MAAPPIAIKERAARSDELTQRVRRTGQLAVYQWGTTSQVNQCQEECGELIAAFNRLRRGRITPKELASEVADVIIMIEQARQIVNALGGDVEAQILAKIQRLESQLSDPK